METKFNLHDLFGIFFPGAVLCVAAFAFLSGHGYIDGSEWGWGESLALLPTAYVVGVLVHHYAKMLVRIATVHRRIVGSEDLTFPAAFKARLFEAIESRFKIVVDPDKREGDNVQVAFDLCYDYVIKNSAGSYTESHYALYGLCRSMILVSLILGILAAFAWGVLVGLAVPLLLIPGFWVGMRRYANQFAVSVYRSFYVAEKSPAREK